MSGIGRGTGSGSGRRTASAERTGSRAGSRPHSPTRQGWLSWLDRRGDGVSPWAFVANRVAGLVLVGYLYLHLVVLSMLVRGDRAWDAFLAVAGHPAFLVVDLVLFAAVLWHAANGVRLALVGTGAVVHRQRALLAGVAVVCVVTLVAAAVALLGET